MLKRIATALVLIPIVMLLVLRAPVPVVAAVAGAVALITVQEFLKLTESYEVQPLRLPTYIFVGLFFLLLAASASGETPQLSAMNFVLGSSFACAISPFIFLTIAMRRTQMSGAYPAAAASAFALPTSLCPWECWFSSASSGRARSGYSTCFSSSGRETSSPTSLAGHWKAPDGTPHQPEKNLGGRGRFVAGQASRLAFCFSTTPCRSARSYCAWG